MYICGKLVSLSDTITVYFAYHHQILSSEISTLLQIHCSLAFSLGCLNFLLVPECSEPGKKMHYVTRYGEVRDLKCVCIQITKPCGPRSNMDLTCYIWSTFEFYCANYAIIVLPSQASGEKLVYVRTYQAEIGGEYSRLCEHRLCITKNPCAKYNFGCKVTLKCTAQFAVKHTLL